MNVHTQNKRGVLEWLYLSENTEIDYQLKYLILLPWNKYVMAIYNHYQDSGITSRAISLNREYGTISAPSSPAKIFWDLWQSIGFSRPSQVFWITPPSLNRRPPGGNFSGKEHPLLFEPHHILTAPEEMPRSAIHTYNQDFLAINIGINGSFSYWAPLLSRIKWQPPPRLFRTAESRPRDF